MMEAALKWIGLGVAAIILVALIVALVGLARMGRAATKALGKPTPEERRVVIETKAKLDAVGRETADEEQRIRKGSDAEVEREANR
jgi:hypothetical protein